MLGDCLQASSLRSSLTLKADAGPTAIRRDLFDVSRSADLPMNPHMEGLLAEEYYTKNR